MTEPLELGGSVAENVHGVRQFPVASHERGPTEQAQSLESRAHDDEVDVAFGPRSPRGAGSEQDEGLHSATQNAMETLPVRGDLAHETIVRTHATTPLGGVSGFTPP